MRRPKPMELASAVEVVLHVAGSSNHLRVPLRRPQFCAAGMGDDSLEQDLPNWRSASRETSRTTNDAARIP